MVQSWTYELKFPCRMISLVSPKHALFFWTSEVVENGRYEQFTCLVPLHIPIISHYSTSIFILPITSKNTWHCSIVIQAFPCHGPPHFFSLVLVLKYRIRVQRCNGLNYATWDCRSLPYFVTIVFLISIHWQIRRIDWNPHIGDYLLQSVQPLQPAMHDQHESVWID